MRDNDLCVFCVYPGRVCHARVSQAVPRLGMPRRFTKARRAKVFCQGKICQDRLGGCRGCNAVETANKKSLGLGVCLTIHS